MLASALKARLSVRAYGAFLLDRDQLPRASVVAGAKHNSTRANDGRKCWTLIALTAAMEGAYRSCWGGREKSLPRM